MKKLLTTLFILQFAMCSALFAQSADDDFFFDDDGIDEFVAPTDARTEELNHGALFETGSIKIGGTFDTSLSTQTILYADDGVSFGDHIKDTTLTPTLGAFLTLDARPTQTLRMYAKFGLDYPFKSTAYSVVDTTPGSPLAYTTVSDYLKVKEAFTDFSIKDRAFFRFGLHTVTWGAGYFYSPVSDMINTSSIDPENTSAQVDGSLNLRTQITFPGTQNCLWFYVIPSTDFNQDASVYLKDTALAGKADILWNNWEFGVGAFYKHDDAPKAMLTATGGLKKMSLFGEFVYQYGGSTEWKKDDSWSDKTSIVQATAGFSYFWKEPSISLAAQYYFDGNDVDGMVKVNMSDINPASGDDLVMFIPRIYQGHNIAVAANFGRIFGTTDINASVFAMANFARDDIFINPILNSIPGVDLSKYENISMPNVIASAMLNFKPVENFSVGVGPYFVMTAFDEPPVVSLKLNASLGGGKF